MTFANLDPSEMLRIEQERSAQLETYAADLNRTYGELRRHLQHMTVLHEVTLRIASALDPDEVLALIENHHLMGTGIGWIDLHLLTSALLNDVVLWTRDRRLAEAADRSRQA